jgi:hypothetical protein
VELSPCEPARWKFHRAALVAFIYKGGRERSQEEKNGADSSAKCFSSPRFAERIFARREERPKPIFNRQARFERGG